MKHRTKNLQETHALAGKLIAAIPKSARVFGLYGDLGSGKTAFVQGIAKALGVTHQVTSPTFVIQKRYPVPEPHAAKHNLHSIIHIDAYRFNEGKDMTTLRWEETLADPGNIVFLEWPEIVESVLPENLIPLKFKFIDETTREIELPDML